MLIWSESNVCVFHRQSWERLKRGYSSRLVITWKRGIHLRAVCDYVSHAERCSSPFFTLYPDSADVSEDEKLEEAEDSDFWDGVTKPEKLKTTFSASEQENQVHAYSSLVYNISGH